jgi:hypothetical protein
MRRQRQHLYLLPSLSPPSRRIVQSQGHSDLWAAGLRDRLECSKQRLALSWLSIQRAQAALNDAHDVLTRT